MWYKLGLRGRLYVLFTILTLITVIGGVVMIRYTYRMERLLTRIIEKDMGALQTAEAFETALVNHKSLISYYFLYKNPDRIRKLEEYRQLFREKFSGVLLMAETDEQRSIIKQIESSYNDYLNAGNRIIALPEKNDHNSQASIHSEMQKYFFKVLQLCEDYKQIHRKNILEINIESRREAAYLRIIAGMGLSMSLFLICLLAVVLIGHILEPVRRLAKEVYGKQEVRIADNEISALSQSVRHLIEDADYTHSELEKSREHLLQAEKMAMVGKLAAGMAHSIRNPFTSVKMRLFSLNRSLKLSETQKEDFEVISQEIRHVDHIVQNFLEFSRPPRLKMQRISPSVVTDMAIQLLEHRVKSYDVSVKIIRKETLAEIVGDPEQLKEVLVNIIINACEAMENEGGQILIQEQTIPAQQKICIRINDNGPGIPPAIREKIFQPFFTTKEEGTGLGLSIASRIIEEHGGKLEVSSPEGSGTTFTIILPMAV